MFYNGIQTDTSIVVIARSTSDGNAVLTLSNGSTDTVAVVAATKYGYGKLEITGLSPDTLYTYSVTIPDGTGGNGQIKTFKSDGAESLAFFSCEENLTCNISGPIIESGVKAAICLGDETYSEDATFAVKEDSWNPATHNVWRAAMREKPDKLYMTQRIGYGVVTDDHDTYLDGMVDDLTRVNATLTTVGRGYTLTVGELADTIAVIGETMLDANQCNPVQNTVTTDADPLYFSFECGNMLIIVPALIMQTKTAMRGDFNGTVPLMNPEQLVWFKALLNDTTKKFKVVLAQKTTTVATLDNNDSWDNYNDLETILQWISDNSSGFAVPGGVIFGTGDWHSPGVGAFNSVDDAYDHVVVNACSCGTFNDFRDPGAWLTTTRQAVTPSEINSNTLINYGFITSTDDYVEIEIKNRNKSTWARARVLAGENKISYPDKPVSI